MENPINHSSSFYPAETPSIPITYSTNLDGFFPTTPTHALEDGNSGTSSNSSSLPGSSTDWLSSEESRFLTGTSPETLETKSLLAGAGLVNLGNTCFMNAVLQCFTHTAPFVVGLRYANHAMRCYGCGEGFCVLCSIREHIEFSLSSMGGIISPFKLVDNLSYFSSGFQRYQQEDAHEFMQCFLDKLGRCLEIEAGDKVSSEDDGLVNVVFGGSMISKLCCCNCGHCSETHEPLVDLSLEIADVDSLPSALESFTKVEKIEDSETKFNCERCKKEVMVEKQLKLEKAPMVVIFHLKRFKNDGSSIEKIDKHISFPLELDLQPYTLGSQNSNEYELYAIVEHTGFSSTSGHYFSFVRSSPDTWYRMDDSKVTRVSEEYVLSQEAYVILYKRKGTRWFSDLIELQGPFLTSDASNPSPMLILDDINNVRPSCLNNSCEATISPFSVDVRDQEMGEIHFGNVTPADTPLVKTEITQPSLVLNEKLQSIDKAEYDNAFHCLTPPRSPSPGINIFKTPEAEARYEIPTEHLKREKCTTTGCGKELSKSVGDGERKAALRYIKKSMPSSRGSKMIAALFGSQSEGPLNKKRSRSSPCKKKSPQNNRRKSSSSHNSMMQFLAAEI